MTFIVLGHAACDLVDFAPGTKISPGDERLKRLPMIGDVNIFLNGIPPSLRPPIERTRTATEGRGDQEDEDEFQAEVDVMIAGK